tara:strand:- start:1430 stop:1762 length:333 start_codon:yes stop_codon:yes gene_type:complete
MPAKKVRISDLQPTDTLRTETVSFLETLTPETIVSMGLPQVWDTSEGLLISDGNHRAAVLASKGHKTMDVDYVNEQEVKLYCSSDLSLVLRRARELMKKGIYSPSDLWQA